MASGVCGFIKKEILTLTERESIDDEDTLSSMGFSSVDFRKVWEKTLLQFPLLKDKPITQWTLEENLCNLLKLLERETCDIK